MHNEMFGEYIVANACGTWSRPHSDAVNNLGVFSLAHVFVQPFFFFIHPFLGVSSGDVRDPASKAFPSQTGLVERRP